MKASPVSTLFNNAREIETRPSAWSRSRRCDYACSILDPPCAVALGGRGGIACEADWPEAEVVGAVARPDQTAAPAAVRVNQTTPDFTARTAACALSLTASTRPNTVAARRFGCSECGVGGRPMRDDMGQ